MLSCQVSNVVFSSPDLLSAFHPPEVISTLNVIPLTSVTDHCRFYRRMQTTTIRKYTQIGISSFQLGGTRDHGMKTVSYRVIPFSVPPRNCLGVNIADMETKAMWVHLSCNYCVSPPPECNMTKSESLPLGKCILPLYPARTPRYQVRGSSTYVRFVLQERWKAMDSISMQL